MAEDNASLLIEGHRISDEEMRIFGAVLRHGTYKAAAEELGFSADRVRRVARTPWFERLFDETQGIQNKAFLYRLQALDEEALDAYEQIIRGERKGDKSVMAVAKLIEARMRSGKNPVLDTRSQNVSIHNEQNTTQVNLTTDQMRSMTPEELIDVQRSGRLPERFVPKIVNPPTEWEPPRELPGNWRSAEAREQAAMEAKQESMEAEPSLVADADSGS